MPNISQRQLVVNDSLINYYESDISSGTQSVVFLHGWRSEGKVWFNVMQHLDMPSYALDLPGFGQSPLKGIAYTVNDYVKVVNDFIKKLDLKNVFLIGHSFGGRIAMKLAASDSNIARLVLVDAAGFRNQSLSTKVKKFIASIVKPLFKLPGLNSLRPKIYKLIGAEDYLATPQLQQTFVNVINEDLTPYLTSISQPTLLIWGKNDKDTPVDFARTMNTNITGSQLRVIEHAGHFSFLDQPQQFIDLLKQFINS